MAFQKKALQLLSASTQYASIADGSQTGLDLASDFTLEAWIKPYTITGHEIMSKWVSGSQQAYTFEFDATTLYLYTSSNGTATSTCSKAYVLKANLWTHVAVAYTLSTGTAEFYINGVSIGTNAGGATSLFNSTAAFAIGKHSTNSALFNGMMKHVRVFNDIRTSGEILSDMLATTVSNANLKGEWSLESVYTDASGNSNTLTSSGSPVFLPDVPFSTVNSTDWTQSKKLIIPSGKVSGSSNLTNFPVVLKNTVIPAAIFTAMQTGEVNESWLMDDTTHLKGYFRMNTGALTTDSSGNANTLTNNNTVGETASGKFGYAADFGSANTNKYLSKASNLGIGGTSPITVSFWVKLSTEITTGYYGLFNHTDSGASRYLQLYYDYNAGTRRLVLDNAGTTGTYTVALGTSDWYHVVVTRNSSNQASLYINNVLVISNVAQGATGGGSTIISFGTGNSLAIFLSGLMDDIAVLSRAISVEEIKAVYRGGHDLRLTTDSAGVTEVPFEIVDVVPGSSTAEVWLKIPTAYYNQNTDFYIWSGNNRAMPYAKGGYFGQWNVWADYAAVHHLEGSGIDATINVNSGTDQNVDATNYTTGNGHVGKGLALNGTDEYLSIADANSLDITSNLTLQALVKPNTPSGDGIIYEKGNPGSAGTALYLLFMTSTRTIGMGVSNGTTYKEAISTGTITNAAYTLVHGEFVPSTSVKTFLAGSNDGTNTTSIVSAIQSTTATAAIGRDGNASSRFLKASVDEVRVKAGLLTDDWKATEQTMFNNPATFVISTVTLSVTKSLAYAIKVATAITKSDQYTVKRPISVTKQAQYMVYRTIAAITKGLVYSIVPDNVITKAIEYMILRSIGITKSMAYAIILEQIVTKSMAYAVLNENSITKSLAYMLLTDQAITKSMAYILVSQPLIQKSMQYHIGLDGYIYNYTDRGTTYTDQYQ